jgi:hypothetical protein
MNALHNLIFLHETDSPFVGGSGIHFCAKRIGADPTKVKIDLINSSFRIAGEKVGDVVGVDSSELAPFFCNGVNAILTIGGVFPFVVGAMYVNDGAAAAPIWDGNKWTHDFCAFLIGHGVDVRLVSQLADAAKHRRHDTPISTPGSNTPTPQMVLQKLRARMQSDIAEVANSTFTGIPTAPDVKAAVVPPVVTRVMPKIMGDKASPLHRAMQARSQTIGLVLPEQR